MGDGGSILPRTTARRLGFTSGLNVLVFKVTQLSGVHVADYGKTTVLFEHTTFATERPLKKIQERRHVIRRGKRYETGSKL